MKNEAAANIAKSLEKLSKAIEEAGKDFNSAFVKTESKTENVLPDCPDISFVPRRGDNYYYPNAVSTTLVGTYRNYGDEIDNRLIHHGLCYPYTEGGKKAAILHAKAMLGIADKAEKKTEQGEVAYIKWTLGCVESGVKEIRSVTIDRQPVGHLNRATGIEYKTLSDSYMLNIQIRDVF